MNNSFVEFKDNVVLGYKKSPIVEMDNCKLPKTGIVSVIGKNGVGKTTLFRTLMGTLKPITGTIMYGERDLSKFKVEEIGKLQAYIPQNISTVLEMTVASWIMMGLAPHKGMFYIPNLDDNIKVMEVAATVGLRPDLLRSPVNRLSGGEMRRAAIARALLQSPQILILDELYSQMDLDACEEIRELIYELSKERLVLQATHSVQVAINTSTLVLAIAKCKGFIVAPCGLDPEMLKFIYNTDFKTGERRVTMTSGNWVTHNADARKPC